MSDINNVILVGRLSKDPELRHTPNGAAVANFSLAVGKVYTSNGEKKEEVSFINCTAWQKLGETIAQYCKKGERIGITGELKQRSWEDSDGNKKYALDVVVRSMQFLQQKSENSQDQTSPQDVTPPPAPPVDDNPFSDDDIPF